jgi:hypothetical protein
MGKEIAPRVLQLVKAVEKRNIAGFNTALNYATGVLKTGPEVQLGTGEGGSGVGITQKLGTAAATAASATTTTKAAAARDVFLRDEIAVPNMKTTVTTAFVRGGPAPAVVGRTPSLPFSLMGERTNEEQHEVKTPLQLRRRRSENPAQLSMEST